METLKSLVLFVVVSALGLGCSCGITRFIGCKSNADCVDGSMCRSETGTCVLEREVIREVPSHECDTVADCPACEGDFTPACERALCLCLAVPPEPPREVCNGGDDDGDGVADEGMYVLDAPVLALESVGDASDYSLLEIDGVAWNGSEYGVLYHERFYHHDRGMPSEPRAANIGFLRVNRTGELQSKVVLFTSDANVVRGLTLAATDRGYAAGYQNGSEINLVEIMSDGVTVGVSYSPGTVEGMGEYPWLTGRLFWDGGFKFFFPKNAEGGLVLALQEFDRVGESLVETRLGLPAPIGLFSFEVMRTSMGYLVALHQPNETGAEAQVNELIEGPTLALRFSWQLHEYLEGYYRGIGGMVAAAVRVLLWRGGDPPHNPVPPSTTWVAVLDTHGSMLTDFSEWRITPRARFGESIFGTLGSFVGKANLSGSIEQTALFSRNVSSVVADDRGFGLFSHDQVRPNPGPEGPRAEQIWWSHFGCDH